MSLVCQRVATVAQAEALLPILRAAEEGEERIIHEMRDLRCATYAAYVGEKLVGAAVVRWMSERSEIMYIAVVAEERGKGHGKSIMAAIQAELPTHGRILLVGTANSSLENIAFYQRCGFRMFEVRRDYFDYIQPPLEERGIVMRDMLVFSYELK